MTGTQLVLAKWDKANKEKVILFFFSYGHMGSPTPLEMSLHSCELRAPQAHTESTQAFIIKTVSKAPSSQATQVYLETVN